MIDEVEAEIVEEETTELATKKDEALSVPAGTPAISVRPRTFESIAEAMVYQKQQLDLVVKQVLEEGKHFGVIPGTDNKTLLKPGAAALFQAFQLRATPEVVAEEVRPDYYGVTIRINVHNQSGEHVGGGLGFASSDESKWQRSGCPDCGERVYYNGPPKKGPDNREGWKKKKADNGEMYSCKDYSGCGWISMEPAPKVYSPDLRNTILKMAEKRARVDAALAVTGADAFFTQDMDDKVSDAFSGPKAPDAAEAPPRRQAKASRGGGVASPSSPPRAAPAVDWSGLISIMGAGRNDDGSWALRVCAWCASDMQEKIGTKKDPDKVWFRCTNHDCGYPFPDTDKDGNKRVRNDGTYWPWTSFSDDPWRGPDENGEEGEIGQLIEAHLDGTPHVGTEAKVEPKGETDPGKWLNLILEPVIKETVDRRKRVTAAMKELGYKNPMSQTQASEVSEAVMNAWYADYPDEAPF